MPEILTVGRATLVVRRSRFLAYAEPAAALDDALARRQALYAEHPGADHVVMAARIAPGVARALDDGEPKDTAGRPLLSLLERRALTGSALYVVRFFGGTKLGRGGLVRAYQAAAQLALAEAGIGERPELVRRRLVYPAHLDPPVAAALRKVGAVVESARHGETTERVVRLPAMALDALRAALGGRPVHVDEPPEEVTP